MTPWKGDETPWKGDEFVNSTHLLLQIWTKKFQVDLDFKGTEKVLNRVDLVAYVPKDSTASTMVSWSNPWNLYFLLDFTGSPIQQPFSSLGKKGRHLFLEICEDKKTIGSPPRIAKIKKTTSIKNVNRLGLQEPFDKHVETSQGTWPTESNAVN